jgi:hypothetical protein
VVRFLLDRGATPDIFLASALGDRALVAQLIDANPRCVGIASGVRRSSRRLAYNRRGGTIYQWTLAFNSYAHQVALLNGHRTSSISLWARSDDTTRLLVSCVLGRRADAEAIAARHPGIIASLPAEDLELLPKYCWETNTNYDAVKLMLDSGLSRRTDRAESRLHRAPQRGVGGIGGPRRSADRARRACGHR